MEPLALPGNPRHGVVRVARLGGNAVRSRLTVALGGSARTTVVVVLAGVLALSSADAATVGASAIELRQHLHIDNADIGLLVAVSSLVGAVAALPFGILADKVRRTWTLSAAVVLWGGAMLWSATVSSFGSLLLTRLALGVVTAAAGPIVASLVGDYFPSRERGRIYSFILTGELIGAGLGFAVTGDIAALSWRLAFGILAIPAFVLAYVLFHLPEPLRGGQGALVAESASPLGAPAEPPEPEAPEDILTDAQRLAQAQHIAPDPSLLELGSVERMGFFSAARYVLRVRTNVALIISGACGYYFLSGVQTFGVEFVHGEYHVSQVLANLLMLLVGGGAAAGVIVAGPLSDRLLRNGRLKARIEVPAFSAVVAVLLFIPALVTHSALSRAAVHLLCRRRSVGTEPTHRRGSPRRRASRAVGPGRRHPHLRPLRCPGSRTSPLRGRLGPLEPGPPNLGLTLDVCDHAPPPRRQRALLVSRHAHLSDRCRDGGRGHPCFRRPDPSGRPPDGEGSVNFPP